MKGKLYRSSKNKKLCGVCGGIGNYFNIDANIIRIGWIAIMVFNCILGLILYFACVLLIPKDEEEEAYESHDEYYEEDDDDY